MIGGTGYALPYPTQSYPGTVPNAPSFPNTNRVYLSAGMAWLFPPGQWMTSSSGTNTAVQLLDPVSGAWFPASSVISGFTRVNADGSNQRLINLSGLPVDYTITAAGSGYIQSTTTVVSSAGGSQWRPIIGGAVNATITIGTDSRGNVGGTNFSLAPLLFVQVPGVGGVQARASCTISGGAINSVTLRFAGAGYTSAPQIMVVPNPLDPNIGLITIPVLTTTVTGAGTLTGLVLTNPGTSQGSTPTLAINGAGSGATATVTMFNTTPAADTVFLQLTGGVA